MVEGDDEDLWMQCFGTAMELHGFSEGVRPTAKMMGAAHDDIIALADRLYDRCKAKTAKADKRPKLVTQLKEV